LGCAASIAYFVLVEVALAQCQGNACGDLVVQQQDGCIVLVNKNPSKKIKIVSNAVPSTVYDVYANSQTTPTVYGGGQCHKQWYQSYNANYN